MVVDEDGHPISAEESDLDRPTKGFSSIEEAIEDIKLGKVVEVVNVVVVVEQRAYLCFCLCRWWWLLTTKIEKTKEI